MKNLPVPAFLCLLYFSSLLLPLGTLPSRTLIPEGLGQCWRTKGKHSMVCTQILITKIICGREVRWMRVRIRIGCCLQKEKEDIKLAGKRMQGCCQYPQALEIFKTVESYNLKIKSRGAKDKIRKSQEERTRMRCGQKIQQRAPYRGLFGDTLRQAQLSNIQTRGKPSQTYTRRLKNRKSEIQRILIEVIDNLAVLSSKGEILDPCSCEGIHLVLCGGGMEVTGLYHFPVFWVALACGEERE